MDIILSTGNRIVDAVGRIHFSGNIIPEAWYKTIINEKGNVHFIAINILADLVYWYRPSEIRDEHSNIVCYKKKFAADDFVQKSYEQLSDKFNISAKQARTAIETLEKLGVVKRHFKTIDTKIGKCSNVMYLELFPDVLYRLTFPDGEYNPAEHPIAQKVNRSLPKGEPIIPFGKIANPDNDNTYTETPEEITTTDTTTAEVVDLLSSFNLKEADINKIIKIANGSLDKITQAVTALRSSHSKIDNITGFLISAIKNEYTAVSHRLIASNGLNNSSQREYNWDEINQIAFTN